MQDTTPSDWLQFACLGKVAADGGEGTVRRHPIYVHSKMMVVDDEYVLVGSANINERRVEYVLQVLPLKMVQELVVF